VFLPNHAKTNRTAGPWATLKKKFEENHRNEPEINISMKIWGEFPCRYLVYRSYGNIVPATSYCWMVSGRDQILSQIFQGVDEEQATVGFPSILDIPRNYCPQKLRILCYCQRGVLKLGIYETKVCQAVRKKAKSISHIFILSYPSHRFVD